jgi:hypothetical protein
MRRLDAKNGNAPFTCQVIEAHFQFLVSHQNFAFEYRGCIDANFLKEQIFSHTSVWHDSFQKRAQETLQATRRLKSKSFGDHLVTFSWP